MGKIFLKFRKIFLQGKFNNWYSSQLPKQFEEGKRLHDMDVPLKLSLQKSFYVDSMVELYNELSTIPSKERIHSGWKAAGITDALNNNEIDSLQS